MHFNMYDTIVSLGTCTKGKQDKEKNSDIIAKKNSKNMIMCDVHGYKHNDKCSSVHNFSAYCLVTEIPGAKCIYVRMCKEINIALSRN